MIATCPVCRLATTTGPVHMRCRCPAEISPIARSARGHGKSEALRAVVTGPAKLGKISRKAVESLGVEGFTCMAVVEFVAIGKSLDAGIAEILSERAGRLITAAECARARAEFPA